MRMILETMQNHQTGEEEGGAKLEISISLSSKARGKEGRRKGGWSVLVAAWSSSRTGRRGLVRGVAGAYGQSVRSSGGSQLLTAFFSYVPEVALQPHTLPGILVRVGRGAIVLVGIPSGSQEVWQLRLQSKVSGSIVSGACVYLVVALRVSMRWTHMLLLLWRDGEIGKGGTFTFRLSALHDD